MLGPLKGKLKMPGVSPGSPGASPGSRKPAVEEEDDDLDMFGDAVESDDEDDTEMEPDAEGPYADMDDEDLLTEYNDLCAEM